MGVWLNDQRCFTKAFINALTKRTYDSNAEISEQYLRREFYLKSSCWSTSNLKTRKKSINSKDTKIYLEKDPGVAPYTSREVEGFHTSSQEVSPRLQLRETAGLQSRTVWSPMRSLWLKERERERIISGQATKRKALGFMLCTKNLSASTKPCGGNHSHTL